MILQTIIITWRIARENDKKLIHFDILHNIILSSYDLLVRVICQFIIKLTFVVIMISRNHYPLCSKSIELFLFIHGTRQAMPNYRRTHLFNQINTTGVTSEAGTAYPSGAPELCSVFQWGSCYSIFHFMCNVLQIVVCPFSFGPYVVCSSSIYGF